MIATSRRLERLERILAVALGLHLLAPFAMIALLPGLPVVASLGERAHWIAAHQWLWRLAWIAPMLAIVWDAVLATVLLTTPRISRPRAVTALAVTLAAVTLQLVGIYECVTGVVTAAASGVRTADLGKLAIAEASALSWLVGWGWIGRAVQGLCWSWAVQKPYGRSGLRRLSWPLWALVALAAAATLVWSWTGFPFALAAGLGSVAFGGMIVWLARFAEGTLTVPVPYPPLPVGAAAPWFPPWVDRSSVSAIIAIANSRLFKRVARRVVRFVPPPQLLSDAENVTFVCRLVPVGQMRPFVPEALQLQTLGPGGAWTLFTVVAYRHRHLGPRAVGPLRRICASPLQCDWRAHVWFDPGDGRQPLDGTYLVSGCISSTRHALLARLWSEGFPLHRPLHFELDRNEGALSLSIDPGDGTAPDLVAAFGAVPGTSGALPEPFDVCFETWQGLVRRVLGPSCSLSVQPHLGRIAVTGWRLFATPKDCRPLGTRDVTSRFGLALYGEAPAVSFVVERARLALDRPRFIALAPGDA